MKNMQNSLEVEEKFVDGAIESLESLPTATATHELDVSKLVVEEVVVQHIPFRSLSLSSCTYYFTFRTCCTCCKPIAPVIYVLPNDSGSRGWKVCVRLNLLFLFVHTSHHGFVVS